MPEGPIPGLGVKSAECSILVGATRKDDPLYRLFGVSKAQTWRGGGPPPVHAHAPRLGEGVAPSPGRFGHLDLERGGGVTPQRPISNLKSSVTSLKVRRGDLKNGQHAAEPRWSEPVCSKIKISWIPDGIYTTLHAAVAPMRSIRDAIATPRTEPVQQTCWEGTRMRKELIKPHTKKRMIGRNFRPGCRFHIKFL